MPEAPPTRYKVLNIVVTLGLGGTEKFLLRTISHLDRDRWQMDVLCNRSLSGDLLPAYQKLDIQLFECPQSYFNPISWWRLYRIIRKNKYDVVCDFNGDLSGISLFIARLGGARRRIAWYRSASVTYKRGIRDLYAAFSRWLVLQNATSILSNAAANFQTFHTHRFHTDKRFQVIPNGIPLKEFRKTSADGIKIRDELAIPHGTKVIGHVGSFSPEKNHNAILEVAHRILAQRNDVVFLLVGDGKLREQIDLRAKALKIRDSVIMVGRRNDIPSLFKAMDVFFFPSHFEGLPNALIEAMLSGVPIVASDIASNREAIPPFYHSCLFPINSHEKAVSLINSTLEHTNLDLTTRVTKWCADRYDIGNVIREYEKTMEAAYSNEKPPER